MGVSGPSWTRPMGDPVHHLGLSIRPDFALLLWAPAPLTCKAMEAMDVTKPYGFIGFGAMGATKPYEFIGFEAKWLATKYH